MMKVVLKFSLHCWNVNETFTKLSQILEGKVHYINISCSS